jgi:hypothetical protein
MNTSIWKTHFLSSMLIMTILMISSQLTSIIILKIYLVNEGFTIMPIGKPQMLDKDTRDDMTLCVEQITEA